ncbi:MAG: hypothetical protein AAGG46_06280, partial [Planctomycetota bacterium]
MPKFSLRLVLVLVTAAAGLSAVLARAVAGDAWAIALSVAVAWAAFALLVHGVFYVAAAALSGLGQQSRAAQSSRPPAEAPLE